MSNNISFLKKYVKPYTKSYALCQAYTLFGTLSGLAFPYILGTLLDSAFTGNNPTVLVYSLVFLAVVMCSKEIFNFLKTKKVASIHHNMVKDMRLDAYEALSEKSLDYYDRTKSGDIVSGLTGDIDKIQATVTNTLINLIQGIISLITVISMLFLRDIVLTLLTLTVIPLIIYLSGRSGKKVKPLSSSIRGQTGFIIAMINESIAGMTIIKLFQLEKLATKMFDDENKKLVNDSVKETGMRAFNSLTIGLLYLVQFVLVVALGSIKVFRGSMTPGALISFILYADMIGGPLSLISGIYLDMKSASASIDRVRSILQTDDPYITMQEKVHQPVEKGDIQFENVYFSYKGDQPVLDDISFHISSGMTAAFVGKSGAGKSTVLKLLPKFYTPQKGNIKIDGISIKDYDTAELRKHIAIVPQESFLFGMSIKDNILCGKPDATDDQVIDAAKKANAHEFIKALPQGYETIAGERGANLSGGQRQRIAIARAFIKSPKILLLDEATSALDNETQSEVQLALNLLMKDRTVIVIAHRLSTVMNADIIFVLDQGRIIQQGTHKELMDQSLLYRSLYREYSVKT